MKFTLSHKRDLMGNLVTAKVSASSNETISRVETRLDGHRLAVDRLSPTEVQYTRIFPRAGNAGPGVKHVLLVTARNDKGLNQTASRRWEDTR
jgi:hypothetical protein